MWISTSRKKNLAVLTSMLLSQPQVTPSRNPLDPLGHFLLLGVTLTRKFLSKRDSDIVKNLLILSL